MTILEEARSAPTSAPTLQRTKILESLAARFRAAGLFTAIINDDGTLAWHDGEAAPFFTRLALPLIQRTSAEGATGSQWSGHDSAIEVRSNLPGVLFAIVPHRERRLGGLRVALAAREEGFALTEDVLRGCTQLSLDSNWLAQQAAELPGYCRESLLRQAKLFVAALRDQTRLVALEHELDCISSQLAATYEELSLIYQISGGMGVNRSPADFFKQTCLEVVEVTGVKGIGVAIRPDSHGRSAPVLYGQTTLPAADLQRLGDHLLHLLSENPRPIMVNDLAKEPNFGWLAEYGRRLLAAPLQGSGQVLGCLFALDKESLEFDSADEKLLLSIANTSAIYLENSRFFADLHELTMGLLHSLTSAVDAKDAYTCGHSERVALLSRHLAQQAGLSDGDVDQIYMAALLHDVGKIGVPEAVLQKTGKLTAEEFELMKKHPQIGARILQDVRQLQHIIPGVLHHHERYDGRGYPKGLAGQDIPLMGRIICLADSFDAMTSNRTYRRALPLEVALAEIRRCAGTHFDPMLAEAFLQTRADHYRDLLKNHQEKSKKLLEMQEAVRAA